jgi:LysR family carnitine catabolism transcriptional activator
MHFTYGMELAAMDFIDLKAFNLLVELRSISEVAKRLDVSQPTVTRRIRKLEKELGVPLVYRAKRPLQLTSQGLSFAKVSISLIRTVDGLKTSLSAQEGENHVVIAATEAMARYFLPPLVIELKQRFPRCPLTIYSHESGAVFEMVSKGEADIGFVPFDEAPGEFVSQPVLPFKRVLVVPHGHPLTDTHIRSLEDIAKYPMVLRTSGQHPRSLRNELDSALNRKHTPHDVVLQLDTFDTIKRYVSMGLGISIVPSFVIEPQDYNLMAVIDLQGLMPDEIAGAITLSSKTLAAPALELLSLAKAVSPGGSLVS